MLLSFVSDGSKRLQHASEGFDLATATDARLLEIFEHDQWGLLGRKRTAAPPAPEQA